MKLERGKGGYTTYISQGVRKAGYFLLRPVIVLIEILCDTRGRAREISHEPMTYIDNGIDVDQIDGTVQSER